MQRRAPGRAHLLVREFDPWLMLALLCLVCLGVLMVYSASIGDAYAYYGSQYYVLERQVAYVVVGVLALIVTAKLPYHHWRRMALFMFAASWLLLGLVLTPHVGHASHGARRWFSLGAGVTIEPSELIKLALVVYLAAWLPSKRDRIQNPTATFVPFSAMVGSVFILIVKQPDLGTGIVVALTAFAVYYVAGADVKHLGIVGAGSAVLGWSLIHSSSYREQRLTAFMNPWHDPTGVGYHTVQAILALGSGGLLGRGLGNGVGKFVLPAPHTDSILAVIGEELGFVGTVGTLALFLVIAYRGMRIAGAAPDPFGRLLAAGITSWITIQALLNFAVITSSVPFTGVPLPFVSYGGTSLIITMAATGILLNISRHSTGEAFARHDLDHRGGDGGPRVPRALRPPLSDSRPRVRISPTARRPGTGTIR